MMDGNGETDERRRREALANLSADDVVASMTQARDWHSWRAAIATSPEAASRHNEAALLLSLALEAAR